MNIPKPKKVQFWFLFTVGLFLIPFVYKTASFEKAVLYGYAMIYLLCFLNFWQLMAIRGGDNE